MNAPRAIALPLEDDWRSAIDQALRAHRWPTTDAPSALGALVRALSDAYNAAPASSAGAGRAVASSAPAIAARLGFSFARDVPKSAAALRELVRAEPVAEGATVRLLDLGAGLGATTWGAARAIAASGRRARIVATWVDEDAMALDVAGGLVRAREGRADADGRVTVEARIERRRASASVTGAPYDLILAGQVLSELDAALEEEERAQQHAEWLESLVGALAPRGALVVIEPALRERTRHLHAVRDALLGRASATVFAPCLHAGPCPARPIESEWCHEDLPIDLPEWLVPVARAAGLRWQGLTFSYLVLRRPGLPTLVDALAAAPARVRLVSNAIVTKGKREHITCGADGARARAMRLDRETSDANAAWSELARGDLVALEPPLDPAKPRVGKDTRVTVLHPRPEGGES